MPVSRSMAVERLNLALGLVRADPDSGSGNGRQASADGDGSRAPRLPRWTRQEILVLIQGKRVVENRVRRGRTGGIELGSGQMKPKWASVSSYCKRHGVNRGPVQCRKRWCTLAGDFKKIKEWESAIREESESFWVMKNDLRRERKLPGFFDREVYDIVERSTAPETVSPAGTVHAPGQSADDRMEGEEVVAAVKEEAMFDSDRSAAVDDGLFSDFVQTMPEEVSAAGNPVKKPTPPVNIPAPVSIPDTRACGQEADINPETGDASREGHKRKWSSLEGDKETKALQYQLIDVLEKNGQMLSRHLESQNSNSQLNRVLHKDHLDNLVAVMGRLTDALVKIADKL